MNWYDGIVRRFVPKKMYKVINGEGVRMEIDSFDLHCIRRLYYRDEEKYVRLQERHFILNNAIGKIAKSVSNAHFSDVSGNDTALLNLINNPNEKQSKEEFLKEFSVFIRSSGYTMLWKRYESYGDIKTLELINLNPDLTDVKDDKVVTEIDDKKITILKKDIVFFYDIRKNVNDDRGYSRIKPLRSQVENTDFAQIAKGIQIINSGITIVSPKATTGGSNMDQGLESPITDAILPEGMKTQKQDMEEKLGGRTIDNRIIVASRGVDSVNLSASIADIKYDEIVEKDILAIYDAFGIPQELTPYGNNAKYDNKEIAENSIYENEALPLVQNLVNSLNAEFPSYGEIEVDFNHVSSVVKIKNESYNTNKTIAETYANLAKDGIITAQEANRILKDKGVI